MEEYKRKADARKRKADQRERQRAWLKLWAQGMTAEALVTAAMNGKCIITWNDELKGNDNDTD